MTSATVSMCSTSAAPPGVAADSRRRATAGASRRRHHVASPETGSARAARTGWAGRETREIERRKRVARDNHRCVASRALLGDQEVRPVPTFAPPPRAQPRKIRDQFPRAFSSRFRRARRGALEARGAPTDFARVPPRARSRADRRSRRPFRSVNAHVDVARSRVPTNARRTRRLPPIASPDVSRRATRRVDAGQKHAPVFFRRRASLRRSRR